MKPRSYLLDLQWTQLAHDERYHKDIVIMPLGERVKHMALHMAKYVGYLAEIEGEDEDEDRVAHILTDAFIITLATANTLNQDLGRDLGDVGDGVAGLDRLAGAIGSGIGQDSSVGGLLRPFAQHAGALAKACESLDHMEAFPFRSAMRDINLALFKLIVAAGAARSLPLEQRYRERLRTVEERSIFDGHLQSTAAATAS